MDENGRRYEIHHIDGDTHNNSRENLVALSIQDHYRVHLLQGDWGAAAAIARRMKLPHTTLSKLARNLVKKRIDDGTWHFTKNFAQKEARRRIDLGIHNFQRRDDGTSLQTDRVKNKTHHLLRRPDGTSHATDAVKAGTHHLLRRSDGSSVTKDRTIRGENPFSRRDDGTSITSDKVTDGTHPWQNKEMKRCKNCGEMVDSSNFGKWHGDKCGILDPSRCVEFNGKKYANLEQASRLTGVSVFLIRKSIAKMINKE